MKITNILSKIITDALVQARRYKHEFMTPEHLLASAVETEFVKEILSECGANPVEISQNVNNYLATKVPIKERLEETEEKANDPVETVGFQSVMNRAVFHCVASDRTVLDVTDVLVSMLDEHKNYCSYFMKKGGVEKLHLLEVISKKRNKELKKSNSERDKSEADFATEEKSTKKSALERFTVDMTKLAKEGAYDALIGRNDEIERTIQILCRRVKNNPLHVGDAGVGKTAITQGLAQRIVNGQVPSELKDFSVYALDIGLLLAGSKFRGDFEDRLHTVVEELVENKKSILFIDEIHMIMGAGTNGNTQIDAANLLKPFLSSGKIRCIGSTTYDEYAKNFEKDKALARRFQKIDINEPTKEETVKILKGLITKYQKYHNVKYTNQAIEEAVNLSVKYLPDRRLPDKAIDVIDEAGSFVKISGTGGFLGNQKVSNKVPMVTPLVVKKIVSSMAKVAIETVAGNEKEKLKNIETNIFETIYGQNQAVLSVCKTVKQSRAGFKNPEKPQAIFLFVGPTGVGKTELAKSLSKALDIPLLRYDMSEYQERHAVSRLIGSPPGYVGYESGGLLTDDVRKNPQAVILFDEIEKAHEDIYNVFLQVMDYGFLTDNQGRKADFRNSIIIMTSNAGARDMEHGFIGFGNDEIGLQNEIETLKEAVNKEFSPEFRNRLDAIVPFVPLTKQIAVSIAKKEIQNLNQRLAPKNVCIEVTDKCLEFLVEEGYSKEFGARNMSRTVENLISSALVDEVLFGCLEKGGKAIVDVDNEEKIKFIFW